MTTVAEIELPVAEFALQQTLQELPDASFEIERVVASNRDHVMPYVWVTGTEPDVLEDHLAADPTIDSFELLTEMEDRWMYQMDWVDKIETLVQMLTVQQATVLSAFGSGDHWDLRILFPERAGLSTLVEFIEDEGLTVEVRRIFDHGGGRAAELGLTEDQFEAVTYAFEQGYYDVPRGATTQDLAESMGISHQALSERLRRAHHSIIEHAVVIGHEKVREG